MKMTFTTSLSLSHSFEDLQKPLKASSTSQSEDLNAFRTEPRKEERLIRGDVLGTIKTLLTKELSEQPYDREITKTQCLTLALTLKDKVKEMLNSQRYKIVCHVIICQNRGQGVHMASGYLWNETTDESVCASFSDENVYAVGVVHIMYYE